jgi:AcrR family transcriptional regulator
MFKTDNTKMNNVQEESLRDKKRLRRRDLLLEVAEQLISRNGLRSLKIRDVAQAADCSIGSIYNEFGDFDGLILMVSRRTVRALDERLSGVPDDNPVQQLYGLADTYLGFASEHGHLLRALFEHRMENDRPFPQDLLDMVMHTFALMHAPLIRLLPDKDPVDVALLARMMFSAVHGIISLGLEERLVAVPPNNLRALVAKFVETHLIGIGVVPRGVQRNDK